MKVKKKELKDRTFIPYEITITIESAAEQQALKKELLKFNGELRSTWYKLGSDQYRILRDLLVLIEEHRE